MNMLAILALCVLATCGQAAVKLVRLGNLNAGNDCGNVIHAHNDDDVTVVSGDSNPSGYCGVLVHAMDSNGYSCNGVCFKVNSQTANDCHSVTSFQGVRFGSSEPSPSVLSCFSKLESKWCMDSTSVRIESIRDLDFGVTSSYSFNISISAQCQTEAERMEQRLADELAARKAAEDVTYYNMVKGVIAGVCLAIVFLIVLLFTYCYYKNRAFRGQRYDYPSKNLRKGPSLAGLKAKFQRNSSGNGTAKKTDTEEAPTTSKKEENAPLVAQAEANAEEVVEIVDEETKPEAAAAADSSQSVPEVKVDEPTPVSEDGEQTQEQTETA